ncbi:type III polyketide synthase [Altererythrobacter aestuarii]|uniref:Type III polyketide synthase n=1 Tax=Alteraurantiacibacter aestuarii TaxID=650004 RepID=A0A844ZKR7_9SPHN|nr:type III polyketide synthase [Alteraurantiacibacter aestuarii]
MRPVPRINAIATALPDGEIDSHYRNWAQAQLRQDKQRRVFARMSARGGIDRRFSVLGAGQSHFDAGSFYGGDQAPGTAQRMAIYASEAPRLALSAIARLPDIAGVTHIVVASCTGFLAPGLDQIIARQLGLSADVERISIGFMGCYAGITALRTAAHIARSDPDARVLTLAVELCTLHLQETEDLEALLAMGQFADGAAAAIISTSGAGLAMGEGISAALEESSDLITWTIGDTGFAMHLSGAVPGRFGAALEDSDLVSRLGNGTPLDRIDAWAVHPGGRSVLDAVERGLSLPEDRLQVSRTILRECGNMSSATVLFVLEQILKQRPETGLALAFGPGLALEGFRFGWTGDAG